MLKLKGINKDTFDDFDLSGITCKLSIENYMVINFYVKYKFETTFKIKENSLLSNNNDGERTFKLNEKMLVDDENIVDYFEDIALYPVVKDIGNNYTIYNGDVGNVIFNISSSNELFNNLIIDDFNIQISGIQSNFDKMLIRIKDGDFEIEPNNLNFSVMGNDIFFDRLEFKPNVKLITNKEIEKTLYYNVKTVSAQNKNKTFEFERLNVYDKSIIDNNNTIFKTEYISNDIIDGEKFKTTTDNQYINFREDNNATDTDLFKF